MPIFRGTGGAGDASTGAYASQVTIQAQLAIQAATDSETALAATVVNLAATNADVVITNQDSIDTAADASVKSVKVKIEER